MCPVKVSENECPLSRWLNDPLTGDQYVLISGRAKQFTKVFYFQLYTQSPTFPQYPPVIFPIPYQPSVSIIHTINFLFNNPQADLLLLYVYIMQPHLHISHFVLFSNQSSLILSSTILISGLVIKDWHGFLNASLKSCSWIDITISNIACYTFYRIKACKKALKCGQNVNCLFTKIKYAVNND